MPRLVFADTQWWVATSNPRDQWALTARRLRRTIEDATIVTTDEVLVEYLGYISGHGPLARRKASLTLHRALRDSDLGSFRNHGSQCSLDSTVSIGAPIRVTAWWTAYP